MLFAVVLFKQKTAYEVRISDWSSDVCSSDLIADEIVSVSPGIAETKVIVAPNSPSALANASTVPATMPGHASGNVTLRNTRHGVAPSVAAACSRRRPADSIDNRVVPTTRGNPHPALARAPPGHPNPHPTP